MEIGERIRQVRMHKGLTQGELVSEICSVTYLSRIESGKIKPSSSFLKQVSKKLGVDCDFLIDGNYEEIKLTILEICNKYKKDKSITEAELSLLELYVREVDSIPLLLKVYGVLIYYHARQENLLCVKSLVDQASRMIPSQVEMQDPEDYIYYLKARGFYFYNKQDYIAAHDIYVQAESLLGVEETEQHAHIYYNLCLVYKGLYKDKSISRLYAQKAYNIYRKNGMEKNVINTLVMLAVLYILDELYEKALEKLKEQNPYAHFKGQHGFVNGEEIEEVKAQIKQFNPHLLLVGLGSPKQEEFIYDNLQTLNVPLSIGIGGMIDIISGTVKRAPKIMRDTGTEWLYRLMSQPKRIKRQLVLPKFLLSVMAERIKGITN
ncbi:WecB/TagA/CpsF family glycosyltransferase [Bacillus mycoides]|uniref:Transcriptional regulator n=1 Tax=Bacillus mycoides TaxID=1405 RepID=A0A1S9SZL8_BACMY|nr:WecB/TagA/CpsF family glycosyltransferase [Bacillus mycoides]OOR03178.1 transcriptional regulator [Bacillus mycoides]